MIRAAAIATVLAGLSSPALATEWLNCSDASGESSFGVLLGAMDFINISATTMSVGDKVWASDVSYGPGDPISIGQAFEDDEKIIVDAVDEGVIIGRLRLFKTSEGTGLIVYGGTLNIPGYGAWAVSCSG